MDTQQLYLDLNSKLFCTFTSKESLEDTLTEIRSRYDILYGKIFILFITESNEYVCTYNIDPFNTSGELIHNTILAHRKKESNTLYTINALNNLIRSLNGNVLDTSYKINWNDYKNSILLTQGDTLRKLGTKVHKIIEIQS